MNPEDELSILMHRAVATVDPPIEGLVAGGIARGRRRIRRRRVGYGLSVAAVAGGLAVVTALAVTGSSPSAGPADAHPAAGHPSGSHSLTSAQRLAEARHEAQAQAEAAARRRQKEIAARAAHRRNAADSVPMTPQALLQTTLELLPSGGTTSHYGGDSSANVVAARFVWDDGQGAAEVDVSIVSPSGAPKAALVDQPCAAATPDCTVLPDGAHALVRQGTENSTDGGSNETEWDLDVVRPDGVEVNYIEFNAPAQKDEQPTRAEPPFTVAQLITWADSSAFQTDTTKARAAAAEHLFTPSDSTPSSSK